MEHLVEEEALTFRDFETDQDVRWCPGCGDYAILKAVQKVMPEIGKNLVHKEGVKIINENSTIYC